MSRYRLAGVLLAAVLPACSGMPTEVTLRLRTGKVLNQSAGSSGPESGPIAVRMFRLKSREKFDTASFDNLFYDPKAFLGDTLVGDVVDIDLGVEKNRRFKLQLPSGVQFVGVMGLFAKQDDQQRWRVVCPTTDAEDEEFLFSGYTVTRGRDE